MTDHNSTILSDAGRDWLIGFMGDVETLGADLPDVRKGVLTETNARKYVRCALREIHRPAKDDEAANKAIRDQAAAIVRAALKL